MINTAPVYPYGPDQGNGNTGRNSTCPAAWGMMLLSGQGFQLLDILGYFPDLIQFDLIFEVCPPGGDGALVLADPFIEDGQIEVGFLEIGVQTDRFLIMAHGVGQSPDTLVNQGQVVMGFGR